jgi:Putative bacterial sensory transduction regulator/T5orf172 domain
MGIVYVLTNEAMPGLVKIGMTDDAASSTGMGPLCSAAVPLPFAVAYACRVENAHEVERSLHVAFEPQRIDATREYFRIDPGQAVAILRLLDRPDVTEELASEAPAEQLELGSDESGTSYVLNLATGGIDALASPVGPSFVPSPTAAAAHRSPMHTPIEPIAQLTPDRLAEILHAGGYEVERDADGEVVARTAIGRVLVLADSRDAMVHFVGTFAFRDEVTLRARLLLANRLNAKGLVARYYVRRQSDLAVECNIVCATGLDPAQLLATLRLFTTHVERMFRSVWKRRYFA